MRVLQIIPSIKSESGGPPRSTLANCRALHVIDPDVETVLLATDERLDPAWREELVSRCPERMELNVLPGRGRHTMRFSLPMLRWMWYNLGGFNLVVIRALLHPLSSAAARLARAQRIPYVLVPHGTLSRYTFRHRRTLMKRIYYHWIDASTVQRAAAIQFTTLTERKEALRLGFETPTAVIPHPYEPRFGNVSSADASPHKLLFLARFDPKKGIPVVLDAMDLIRQEIPSIKLVLAGSGTSGFERKMRYQIQRLRLQDVVELPGFVTGNEKHRLLRDSSVFILPSMKENFGVSVVEAMDAGIPVVISKGVDIWPEVNDAGAGVVLDERTPQALAEAVLRLLRDEQARFNMGRNGRDLVRTAFHPLRVGRDLSRLYWAAAEDPVRVREEFP